MAQRLQEFCALLVDDNCGHICEQIFSTLAERGRLSRLQLQRLTRLPGRQLRTALTVLTQQHILRYINDDDDTARYQVDWRNAYYLTRSNRIISLVEDRYGEGASKIIANVLQLGHARVGDLAQAFDLEASTAARANGMECDNDQVNGNAETNGAGTAHSHKTHGGKITTIGQFHRTVRALLQAGFLVKMNKRSYTPATDLQEEIEEIVISEHFPDRKVTGPKRANEFKLAVNNLKRKWRNADDFSDRNDSDSHGTFRQAGGSNAKRVKLNGAQSNGVGHDDHDENVPKLPNEMVLKVNYAQCTVALRGQRLEQLVEPYLGPVTATVYGALLRVVEGKLKGRDDSLKIEDTVDEDDEDADVPVVTAGEIAEILDPTLDLSLGLADNDDGATNGVPKAKKKTKSRYNPDLAVKEEVESDDENAALFSYTDKYQHLSDIGEHLKLLEEHPKMFCRRIGGGGGGEWRVPFTALTDTLIQAEIDSTVLIRFGKIHLRFVRLLRERGRLEEKQIAALTIMRVKDVRSILTELQYAGIVESQELPRDNSRLAARTTYLWFHDQARARNLLLEQTYQGMSRTLQRLRQEREDNKNVIEKAEMMDIRQEALNQLEREAVTKWRDIEERLIVQVQRMDDLVALLRDFSGKDTSMVS